MIKIIIGADLCPINRNLPNFLKGDTKSIFNDLLTEFENSDLSIVNLECPFIEKNTPIKKDGPVFGVESVCINSIKEAKIDVVNLANNHIMDHGPNGLMNTLNVCAKAGISTVGAGKNLDEARKILIKNIDKKRIGILSVAEHEFSIATENSWGANPLDLIDYVRNVKSHSDSFDYLIVLFHGGNEHYPYPSPKLKDTCHFMVEMGAQAVIVQHTHFASSYEEYKDAHIFYGQGNLILDEPKYLNRKSFHEGFLIKIIIADDLRSTVEIVPFNQSDSQLGARKMTSEGKQLFLESFNERSNSIKDDNFIHSQWLQFCDSKKYEYLGRILGYNLLFRKLNKNGMLVKHFYNKDVLLCLQDFITCESHWEVLKTIFDNKMIK